MAIGSVKDIENMPAEGERRAIRGYYPQYQISASLILRGLRDGTLQWIRVADPLAGRVDDLQISSQSRVDAFQVKWSNAGERLTFRDLTNTSGGDPSLINQLADGWKRLRSIYSGHKIVVHLFTNRTPSTADQIPSEDSGSSRHMAAFLQQVWNPAQKSQDATWNPPAGWAKAWEITRGVSGLSPEEFLNFVRDCKLELSRTIRESESQETREEEILNRDLEHLTQILFATVASPDKIVELNRQKLLETLGWKARFEFRSSHNFPTQDTLYEPIESTAREINEALDKHQQGYIAVLGSPGCGKSTILTHTLRTRRERIIRYYAYVPDAQDPLPLRGESTTFLHDIVLALEKAGFIVGESPSFFDRDHLLSRFHHQLNRLSEDWKTTGRKTVILIDGLDHVARELKPQHSFLRDLPFPEQIPGGIVIILGSQTDQIDDLPDKVQYEIQQPSRRIEMRTLSREAVFRILDKVDVRRVLNTEQKNRIFELSGGHPLALRLIVNQVQDATDTAITTILRSTDPFKGDIEAQYHSYWRQIEKDYDIVHLMGLLARLRRAIDWSWIESWQKPPLVNQIRRQFAQYFRNESESRCYFFHNSFRLFVIARTSETLPTQHDPSRDRSFHLELANICRNSSVLTWAWEEIYHRVSAEEHGAVLEIATQRRFRDQLLAFRPADAVEADIRLSLRSASARQDPIAITRLSLAMSELRQRTNYLRETEVIDLLLDLGNTSTAIEYIRDGNRLRIGPTAALSIIERMVELGLREESQRIFELAEPLELLAAAVPLENDPQDEKGNLLETWARVAINFREIPQIIETIRGITRAPDPYEKVDAVTLTRHFHNRLLFHFGLSLLKEQRWADLMTISSEFDSNRKEDGNWWFWLLTHAMRERIGAGDLKAAKGFLKQLRKGANERNFGSGQKVILAQESYRLLGEQTEAKEQIRLIEQPKVSIDLLNSDSKLDPFVPRFRLNRLLFTLGEEREPEDIIPDPLDAREAGIIYFERNICVISRIWADAWRGRLIDGPTITRKVYPSLHFFNRDWRQTEGWSSWYVLQGARTEFYNLLVEAVAQHGKQAIDSLTEAFEEQWDAVEKRKYWPADICRKVTLFLMRAGKEQSWAVQRLEQIENSILEGQDVSSRVEECQKQAQAWHAVNEDARALKWLNQGLRLSFGVGYRKDYQLDNWFTWTIKINKAKPADANRRILWLARASIALKEVTEGPAASSAANELLKVAFQWSPRRAIKLFNFFLEQRVVSFSDATGVLLAQAVRDRSDPELLLYATGELAVPLFAEADEELAMGLAEYLLTKTTSDTFDTLRYLLSRTRISALPSARKGWDRGIAKAVKASGRELNSVGLSDDALLSDKDEMSSKFLRLQDGTTLSLSAAVEQTRSTEELFDMLEREHDDSYFKWELILTDTTRELDAPTIDRLAEILEKKYYAAQSLAVLSERLTALGMKNEAWELGLRALNISREYGWSRGFDGGSRLAAFRALIRANKQKGRSLMYEVLARDGGGSAGNLDEIIALLVDEIPVPQLWAEVENYLEELLGGLTLSPAKPEGWDSTPADDIPSRAVANMIASHVNHPATPVAVCAQRTSIELLSRNNPHMRDSLIELLTVDESYQENILLILEAVATSAPSAARQFLTHIKDLAQSPNYAIRVAVRRIFRQVQQALDLPPQQTHELPEIYKLSLPPVSDDIDEDRIRADAPLPDSNNPAEIVSPFYTEVTIISEMAGLAKSNLYHRAVQIMRELRPEETWSASRELLLRSILDSAGLKFSFRRPRAVLARRAMFHIIAELLDADMLKHIDPAILEHLVQFADPNMLLYRPLARPQDVIPIIRKDRYTEKNEEWVEKLDDSFYALKSRTSAGRIILAEECLLKILEWELPTEIRRSVVVSDSTPRKSAEEEDSLFKKVTPYLATDYINLDVKDSPLPIVVKNNAFRYDTPGTEWLALNPTIAKDFGWNLSEDGFLRWTDQADETMVETIWWEDGPAFFSPPHLNVEVGRGWLVLASLSAFRKIKERYPNLGRLLRLERQFNHERQKVPVNRSKSIKVAVP